MFGFCNMIQGSRRKLITQILTPDYKLPGITYTQSGNLWEYDSTGKLVLVPVDTQYYSYNPATLLGRGYGYWPARTNLCLSNRDFRSAGNGNAVTFWGNVNISAALASGTAPDGTNTMNAVTCNANGAALSAGSMTIVATNPATVTLFAKKNNCDFVRLQITGTASECNCWFNINTGAVASNDAGTGTIAFSAKSIESVGNGIYRIRLTVTSTVIGAATFNVYNCSADGGSSVSGNIANLWCADFEVGLFETPPIFTTTAAVTRAAPSALITSSNFSSFYNQTQGVFTLKGTCVSPSTYGVAVQVDDGTNNNRIYLDRSGGNARLVSDVSSVVGVGLVTLGAITVNTAYKESGCYILNNYQAAKGGVLGAADTSATVPTVTQMRIGNDGVNFWAGWIDTLTYQAAAMPDATLQGQST